MTDQAAIEQRARCPDCGDLFVPENGVLPTHYVDTWQGNEECAGSKGPANA